MIKVAVIMGGYTDEAQVSLKSGDLVLSHLNPNKYVAYAVHILPSGWNCVIDGKNFPINKSNFGFIKDQQEITFDIVYNTIHGTPGEDGYLQAYFDLIKMPYTGCGFYQAAITFNKKDCIAILNKYGIKSAKSYCVRLGDEINEQKIIDSVGLPCFVKPNKSGSSLGISKVKKTEELSVAIKKAFEQDSEILIEQFLDGTEISVGVFNYKGKPKLLGITEIISENEFFDYEAKYLGKSEEITPARLSKNTTKKVEEIAIKAYESINMTGFSRSEYIIVNDEPHFIEMNTLPGLSPQSIFPQQAKVANISMQELFDNEIESVLNKK